MEDFYAQLLVAPKWHNQAFIHKQLGTHLLECKKLLDMWDGHLAAELVDLIQIAKLYLHHRFTPEQLSALVQKRSDRFMEKIDRDME